MKTNLRENQEEQFPIIFVIFATLLGLVVRIAPPLQASFPLNDGGLFYVMIRDIQQNNYALPAFTSYNFATLPFAYPPLAFYLTGLLADLTHVDLLDLLRILPAIFSTLTIPAFYLLAKHFLPNRLASAIATVCFALMPRGFEWHVMGGGITRSIGLLLAMLTMGTAVQLFKTEQKRFILWTLVWGALLVATHPEASLQTALAVLIFYLFLNRSLKGSIHSAIVAIGILVLTSPWWGTVVSRYGLGPLLAAPGAAKVDALNPFVRLFLLFRFEFTGEQFVQVLAVMGLIGLTISLAKKEFFLPAWLAIPLLLEPRSAPVYMVVPLSMLAGSALTESILPLLQKLNPLDQNTHVLNNKTVRFFLGFLIVYSVMSSYAVVSTIQYDFTLTDTDLDAFRWVNANTTPDSKFLVLTGQHHLRDAVSEWFPVLAERRSQATVFGYEWVPDSRFRQRIEEYQNLQACLYENGSCLEDWSRQVNSDFSYAYLWNRSDPENFPLGIYLQENPDYELVFQNEQTMIFQKLK